MKRLLVLVAIVGMMVGAEAVPPASLTTEGSSALSTFLADAVARGVFGSPTYVFRGEPFWGQDRLDFLDRALMQA